MYDAIMSDPIRKMTFNRNWKVKFSLEAIVLIAVTLGVFNFKDYGISTDEKQQRLIGLVNTKFFSEEVLNLPSSKIFENIPHLSQFGDSIFGSVYEVSLVVIEIIFKLKGLQEIFETRHLINHLFFIVVVYFFSKKVSKLLNGQLYGVLCFLLFALNPRIYVDSFYNTKDIIHMCAFMLTSIAIARYFEDKTRWNLTLVSVSTVFAINTRVTGVLIAFLFFCSLITSSLKLKKSKKDLSINLIIYFVQVCTLTILTFPLLWVNPFKNFLITITKFARYPLDLDMNYWGETINSESLPWHYFFSWFLVSNPLVVTVLISLSVLICGAQIAKWRTKDLCEPSLTFVLFHFMIFFLALASVIILNSSLYNGWRHLFFVYPSLIYMSLAAIKIVQRKLHFGYEKVVIVVLVTLLPSLFWMVTNHPHGNLYFNRLFSHNAQDKFDVDYWGTANKQILLRITKYDDRDKISVFLLSDTPMEKTLESIDSKLSSRFFLVDSPRKADYLIDTFLLDRRVDFTAGQGIFIVKDELSISNYLVARIFQKMPLK
jgi:hypothetical protein